MKIFFFVLVLALATLASAQAPTVLNKLPRRVVDKLPAPGVYRDVDEFRCGDYFMHNTRDELVGPHLMIFVRPLEKEGGVMIFINSDKVARTYIEDLKQPQMQMVLKGNEPRGNALRTERGLAVAFNYHDVKEMSIFLSRADYEKAARCLPKPQ